MKKKLGALVLTLSALAISAGCASSGASSRPKPPEQSYRENWAKAGPTELPSRSAHAAAAPTEGFASR